MEDQLEALERSADITGGGQINLANLPMASAPNANRAFTIDVAYRYFATPRRKFHHRRHAGARAVHAQHGYRRLQRQLAVVLVDARTGVSSRAAATRASPRSCAFRTSPSPSTK